MPFGPKDRHALISIPVRKWLSNRHGKVFSVSLLEAADELARAENKKACHDNSVMKAEAGKVSFDGIPAQVLAANMLCSENQATGAIFLRSLVLQQMQGADPIGHP